MNVDLKYENLKRNMETIGKIFKYLPENDKKIKTIPQIFNKTYDENFISDFLAYVLNPQQNGIGPEPIVKLIEEYNKNGVAILKNIRTKDKSNIKVLREYTLSDGRRIDILINFNDELIIGIENKIFSGELENQTEDYADSIYNEYPECEYVLLFLTPKGTKPKSDMFTAISYKKLVSKLKKVKFDYRDNIRKKIIFDEFILHVEEYMMSKKSKNISEQTKLFLEYQETIEKLTQHFKKDSTMVFEEFEGIVKSFFEGKEWNYNIKQNRGWHAVYKDTWNIEGLYIHHEFWISNENILKKNSFPYMIEIEGKHKNLFLSLFDKEYEKIKDKYIENNILYRPSNRKIAIAYKELDNYFKADYKKENKFLEDINKFSFIEESIEKVYEEFLKNLKIKG